MEMEFPNICQHSSARCGASGAKVTANLFNTYACISFEQSSRFFMLFSNSINAAIAVLKWKFSISSSTLYKA